MSLCYVQFERKGIIEHYVAELPTSDTFVSFCTDIESARSVLKRDVDELITHCPIYDDFCRDGHYCDEVECLEDEVYRGVCTSDISSWLCEIAEGSLDLRAGDFGMRIMTGDYKGRRSYAKMVWEAVSALGEACDAPSNKIKRDLACDDGNDPELKGFLFRNIFYEDCEILKNHTKPSCALYERLCIYTGRTAEEARKNALVGGKMAADVDTEWAGESKFHYIGIESFIELPAPKAFPILLASHPTKWKWEYDIEVFKELQLQETLKVNAARRKDNIHPYWE